MQTARGASLNDAIQETIDDGESVRPRRIGVLIAVAAVALTIDLVSKAIAVSRLSGAVPVELLGGVLKLRVLRNSGAAFNIGTGMTIVFTVIAAGVVVAILRYARRLRSLPWAVTLGLLLGGALGNLADRVFRAPGAFRGHVVDWIELPHWPVFNLADSAIVCGGALAVLLAARGLQVDGTVHREGHAAQTPASDAPAASSQAPDAAPTDDAAPRAGGGTAGSGPAGRSDPQGRKATRKPGAVNDEAAPPDRAGEAARPEGDESSAPLSRPDAGRPGTPGINPPAGDAAPGAGTNGEGTPGADPPADDAAPGAAGGPSPETKR